MGQRRHFPALYLDETPRKCDLEPGSRDLLDDISQTCSVTLSFIP